MYLLLIIYIIIILIISIDIFQIGNSEIIENKNGGYFWNSPHSFHFTLNYDYA